MAYVVTYKQLIDNVFQTIYFRTSAEAVGETSSLKFFRPDLYTVNGKKFFENNLHKGVTLYGDNINLSSSDSTTISNKISSINNSINSITSSLDSDYLKTTTASSTYVKKDSVLSDGDISKNGYENSSIFDVSALDYYLENEKSFASKAVASASSNGLMSYTDKANLDTLVKLLQDDDDSVINTIQEVLNAFENASEGLNIATTLSNKLDKTGGSITGSISVSGNISEGGTLLSAKYALKSAVPVFIGLKEVSSYGDFVSYPGSDSDDYTVSSGALINILNDFAPRSLLPTTTVGSSAPSSPKNGDVWLDTSAS